MGTAILVLGVLLILAGAILGVYGFIFLPDGIFGFGSFVSVFIVLFETVPMLVIGGWLLAKYYKDLKKQRLENLNS